MARNKKLSLTEVRDVIENEGLGYAVQSYMDGKSIADPELAEMWDRAAELLQEIENYIEDNIEEETPDDHDEDYDPEDDYDE